MLIRGDAMGVLGRGVSIRSQGVDRCKRGERGVDRTGGLRSGRWMGGRGLARAMGRSAVMDRGGESEEAKEISSNVRDLVELGHNDTGRPSQMGSIR